MRPTLTRLRGWTPAALTDCAEALDAARATHLATVGAAHTRTGETDWTGAAATAAVDRATREQRTAATLSATMGDLASALRTGAATIGAARTAALAVACEAEDGLGLHVSDAGRVSAPAVPWLGGVVQTVLIRLVLAERAHTQDARLAAALDAVDAADRALAAALHGLAPASSPAAVPPASEAAPEDNARYWAGLTEAQRRAVLAERPEWIGGRDGIPAAARDAANRTLLEADRRGLRRRLDEITAVGRYRESFGGAGPLARTEMGALRDRLGELDALTRALAGPERGLLVYRGGAQIRAAVSIGDVDTADHVAALTPGVNSTILGDLDTYTGEMAGLRRETARMLAEAGRSEETVATVVWMDYRAPQLDPRNPLGAVRDAIVDLGAGAAARTGARSLASFYRGLGVSRPDPVHVTAIGHSYGSTTTGLALQRGDTGVDDAVFLGSPGLGTDRVVDLALAPGRAYVAEAHGDPVADLAAYGADPNRLPGITNLSTVAGSVDGQSYSAATGHSDYLSEGGMSRRNIAAVVASLGERVVEGTDRGLGDRLAGAPLGELRTRIFGGPG